MKYFSASRRTMLKTAALAPITPLMPLCANAADWPTQAIKVVVPFPPGGNTDIVGRIVAKTMADDLGQPIVIDNRAGAGGNIGVDAVVKARPDGYTLANSTLSTYALNVGVYKKLPYDPVKDLVPVALTVLVPLVLVVSASSGIKTLPQLLKMLRENPGKYNYGSPGNGTSGHIASNLFVRMADVDVQHVPYKGSPAVMSDLIGGLLTFAMDAPSVVGPMIQGGKLHAIAVAVSKRIKTMPTVPTFDEVGLKGYRAYTWNALWAPVGTPTNVLDRLNVAANKALTDPASAKLFEQNGVVPYPPMNRSQVEAFMKREYDYWVPMVRSLKITLD